MLTNYKPSYFKYDLKSGLAVAAISLPVAVAYSEWLGLPPESGIFTAVFSLLCYAILGSSKDLIIGPDSATVALIASSIFALGGLSGELNMQFIVGTTIVSGFIFFIGGFLRLGFISNFISKPILVGFLNGVAVVLLISQITKFTGVVIENSNSIFGLFEFIGKVSFIHYPTLITASAALIIIRLLNLASTKLPSQLLIIIISVICASIFNLKEFGISSTPEIQSGIPIPILPDLNFMLDYFDKIIVDAAAIVLISYANTVLVGKSISRDRQTYNPDKEFFAMGLANTVCGIFRGFPASGSSSRTLVNIDSGAKTKYSMVFGALSMILVVIFFSKQFSMIPSAVFAAIIVDASIGIFQVKELKDIREFSKTEFRISMICMIGVMAIGVLNGIFIALILSLIDIISNASHPPEYEIVFNPNTKLIEKAGRDNEKFVVDEIFIYRFESSMLFFNSDFFRKKLYERISSRGKLKMIIIDVNPVNYIDVTSGNGLIEIINEMNEKNVKVLFYGADERFEQKISEGLVKKNLDKKIFFPDVNSALMVNS